MDSKSAGYPRFRSLTPNPPNFLLRGRSKNLKSRWIPPVPLVNPQPAGFFSPDEKKPSGYAADCVLAD